jgi:hypothetical protein
VGPAGIIYMGLEGGFMGLSMEDDVSENTTHFYEIILLAGCLPMTYYFTIFRA